MRLIFVLLTAVIFPFFASAQTVKYTHKPFSYDECSVEYSVSKVDTTYYILATVRSDKMRFLNNPIMKIRTFKDQVLTLYGYVFNDYSEIARYNTIGNVAYPVTEIISSAQFKVSPKQFELIKSGVSKIRLSMTPVNHERIFKSDKIGKKLYQFYLDAKLMDDDF